MASGEMSPAEFEQFLRTVFGNMAGVSVNGAVHFICMDWRHLAEVMGAAQGVYSGLKNLCVWNKNNGGMGSFYRSKHELVFVYKVGTDPHVNTVSLERTEGTGPTSGTTPASIRGARAATPISKCTPP